MAPNGTNPKDDYKWMLEWNSNLPAPVDTPVHKLIQSQAIHNPQFHAVCSWDGNLTYAELEDYSNRLARKLRQNGVKSEVVVPVGFEKSKWAIVSALAVLKAGGAFLLLDSSQPIARLKSMIEQISAKVALSSLDFEDCCNKLVEEVFVVDGDSISELDSGESPPKMKLSSAAYHIFTSGSTGAPKGVIIEHTQLATTAVYCGNRMGYSDKPRVFQFASYAFDMCITDIFATLVHGGTVCIPSDWERNNDIVGAMQRLEVTSARLTPSLVSNLALEQVSTLQTLILGGESCPAVLSDYWSPRLRLILAYGPTEGCVVCIFSEANEHPLAAGEIGRPVTCEAWIVNPDDPNVLCGIGEIGELLIQGPNVARGYLNDAVKTSRQFVQDLEWMRSPSATTYGNRYKAYRTGDLAKYMDDGTLCWVGRVDNQVKIRGQRLELEEVERIIHQNFRSPDVKLKHVVVEAAMLPGMTSKQLLAFLCFDKNQDVGFLDWSDSSQRPSSRTSPAQRKGFQTLVSNLESAMRSIVPAYAIPSVWVPFQRFPFTLSRKRDRKRLSSIIAPFSLKELSVFLHPTSSALPNGTTHKLTDNESVLQDFWATIFGIDASAIEVTDNFFVTGGDSVLAIRLVAIARARGLDLSLQLIFNNPILADMARVVTQTSGQNGDELVVPPFSLLNSVWDVNQVREQAAYQCKVDPASVEDIYPCSAMQEGLMALSSKDAGTYVLRFVFHMPENVDIERLHAAWEVVSKRTPVLRTRFVDFNAELLQAVIDESLDWKVIEEDLDTFEDNNGDDDEVVGKKMSRHTVLLQSGSKSPVLVWTVHHALVDGWAESTITTSVEQEYQGKSSLPHTAPMFNVFIKHLGEQDTDAAEAFWKKELARSPTAKFPPLPHPTYIPKIKRSNRIAELTLEQGAELDHRITFVKGGNTTVATMIQAAWFVLVGMYSNSSDVVTGVTLNGRTAILPGIDKIAGPTISTVPFRAKIDRRQSVEGYLKSIQDKILSIHPFAQFGLQNIRRLSEDAVSACKFRSLLLVQAANRPADSSKLILERSFAFPVMDFAIVMECELSKDGIDMRATFDHNIMSHAQVQRMFQQMEDILGRIMTRTPSMKVSELQTISDSDLSQVLDWNIEANLTKSSPLRVHELVQQRAAVQASAIAVHSWDGDLNYEELNDYADRLASHLRMKYNVSPGSSVMVAIRKSKWAVVSMLAVLKAGAVCTFNVTTPSNVAGQIREALRGDISALVLTSQTLFSRFRQATAVLVVDQRLIDSLEDIKLKSTETKSGRAAFILFRRSASLDPERITLFHDVFCSRILSVSKVTGRDHKSRVLLHTEFVSLSHLTEIFSTLILGGCICIAPRGLDKLAVEIRSTNSNEILLTPSIARWLRPVDVPSLKTLHLTGEPLTRNLIETWADEINLVNLYGSEQNLGYCAGTSNIKRGDSPGNVGRYFGCSTWIVHPEDTNTLMPPGSIGELLVESRSGFSGGAHGEKLGWVPTWAIPLQPGGNKNFLRTGDLAMFNVDGSINLVGKIRDQIQIGCQQVDIFEVQCQLQEVVPSSIAVSVIPITSKSGRKTKLVAYLAYGYYEEDNPRWQNVSDSSFLYDGNDVDKLQDVVDSAYNKLRSLLPTYKRPSEYIPLRLMPLTPSGKVDSQRLRRLRALSTPLRSISSIGTTGNLDARTPLTNMERRIAELWKGLLEINDVGRNDNFFQLGGGSVLAMRLVSMARMDGISLTVSGVFKNTTLGELASVARLNSDTADVAPFSLLSGLDIGDLWHHAARQCQVGVEAIEDIYPCSVFQLHYVTGYPEAKSDPTKDPWHWQSQGAYILPASIDVDRFQSVWNRAVHRHPVLRTRLINTPSGILQVVIKPSESVIWNTGTDLREYLSTDQTNYMTFGQELIRFGIVQSQAAEERYFIFTAQHVIYDAFMRSMLFKDVEIAYFKDFPNTPLPRMNKFIKYIIDADKEAATQFWTSYLDGADTKPLLNPVEIPGIMSLAEHRMTTASARLSSEGFAEVALPTVIEVASALAIAGSTDCGDVVFYSDRSGRNLPVEGIQDLIGPTTLFLPVRVQINSKQKVHDLLLDSQRIKSDMIPHEHLGFLELREMDHLKPMLRNALNINITPKSITSSSNGWGLKLTSSHLSLCDDPFGINVNLHEDRIDWMIYFDERFISSAKVGRLMEDIKLVFFQLVDAKPGLTVGEVIAGLEHETSS